MKPTSIISLIVAILLIILGLVTCIIAQSMAESNGEALFSETTGNGTIKSISLNDVDISKIDLSLSDGTVNIYGGSTTSYIEFINYRENYYTLSTANRTVTFREVTDILSMLNFFENGFSFKGLRHLLSYSNDTDVQKSVNIYLTADHPVKIFHVEADTCDVSIRDLTTGSDYELEITNGKVTTENLSTTSAFKLNGTDLSLTMKNTQVNTMEATAETLVMETELFRPLGNISITTAEGSISVNSAINPTLLNLCFDTAKGKIILNGVERGTHYEPEKNVDVSSTFTVTTESANISFKHSTLGGGTDPVENE